MTKRSEVRWSVHTQSSLLFLRLVHKFNSSSLRPTPPWIAICQKIPLLLFSEDYLHSSKLYTTSSYLLRLEACSTFEQGFPLYSAGSGCESQNVCTDAFEKNHQVFITFFFSHILCNKMACMEIECRIFYIGGVGLKRIKKSIRLMSASEWVSTTFNRARNVVSCFLYRTSG